MILYLLLFVVAAGYCDWNQCINYPCSRDCTEETCPYDIWGGFQVQIGQLPWWHFGHTTSQSHSTVCSSSTFLFWYKLSWFFLLETYTYDYLFRLIYGKQKHYNILFIAFEPPFFFCAWCVICRRTDNLMQNFNLTLWVLACMPWSNPCVWASYVFKPRKSIV